MLSPKEFASRAGFPRRWQERDLQSYVIRQLKARGFSVEEEVKIQGGRFRADIVTNWASDCTIIEMKKVVSPDDIYKASRQLQIYSKHLGGRRKVIMGLLPDSQKLERAIDNLADEARSDGIELVFLNCEPQWFPEASGWKLALQRLLRLFGNISRMLSGGLKAKESRRKMSFVRQCRTQVLVVAIAFGLILGLNGAQALQFFFSKFLQIQYKEKPHLFNSHDHRQKRENALPGLRRSKNNNCLPREVN